MEQDRDKKYFMSLRHANFWQEVAQFRAHAAMTWRAWVFRCGDQLHTFHFVLAEYHVLEVDKLNVKAKTP